MLRNVMLFSCILLSGCLDEPSQYPSSEGKKVPYILKEDCKFTIVDEYSKSSVTSPEVSGIDEAAISMGTSNGDMSIMVSSCTVVENSHNLSIYEN